jgi:hypothetical protein
MGIDVYLRWKGITEEEKDAQLKCWGRTINGAIGYLREAYDFYGFLGPARAGFLGPARQFEETTEAELLEAVRTIDRRIYTEYADGTPYATRFLCQEAFEADGDGAVIPASKLRGRLKRALDLNRMRTYPKPYHRTTELLDQALRAFVELAEKKEAETGACCTVVAC